MSELTDQLKALALAGRTTFQIPIFGQPTKKNPQGTITKSVELSLFRDNEMLAIKNKMKELYIQLGVDFEEVNKAEMKEVPQEEKMEVVKKEEDGNTQG